MRQSRPSHTNHGSTCVRIFHLKTAYEHTQEAYKAQGIRKLMSRRRGIELHVVTGSQQDVGKSARLCSSLLEPAHCKHILRIGCPVVKKERYTKQTRIQYLSRG